MTGREGHSSPGRKTIDRDMESGGTNVPPDRKVTGRDVKDVVLQQHSDIETPSETTELER